MYQLDFLIVDEEDRNNLGTTIQCYSGICR